MTVPFCCRCDAYFQCELAIVSAGGHSNSSHEDEVSNGVKTINKQSEGWPEG